MYQDITTGDNHWTLYRQRCEYGYTATPGWDAVVNQL